MYTYANPICTILNKNLKMRFLHEIKINVTLMNFLYNI